VVIVATMALVRVVTALSPGLGHRLELGAAWPSSQLRFESA
jgi:hypothetical protein